MLNRCCECCCCSVVVAYVSLMCLYASNFYVQSFHSALGIRVRVVPVHHCSDAQSEVLLRMAPSTMGTAIGCHTGTGGNGTL